MKNFMLKFVYGLGGNALAAFGSGVLGHAPVGDAITVYVWQGLAVGCGTGLVAVGKRLLGAVASGPRPS